MSLFPRFQYYAIQASYQAGGATWNDWQPKVRELLLSKQNGDGSWDVPPGTAESNEGVVGPNKVHWTAMASLVLEDLHALPAGVSTVAVGRVSAAQPTGPSNAQKPGTQNRLGKTGNPL